MARRRYGRRYGRRRGRRSHKIPILSLGILGAQVFAANAAGGTIGDKVGRVVAMYTGYETWTGRFTPSWLIQGYGPWLALGLAKKVIFPLAGRPRLGFLPVSLS